MGSNVCKQCSLCANNKALMKYIIKGRSYVLLHIIYNRIPVVDMTIKLWLSANPIITMSLTEKNISYHLHLLPIHIHTSIKMTLSSLLPCLEIMTSMCWPPSCVELYSFSCLPLSHPSCLLLQECVCACYCNNYVCARSLSDSSLTLCVTYGVCVCLQSRRAKLTEQYKEARSNAQWSLWLNMAALISYLTFMIIRASVDALCRDGPGQISRERVQRGRLTRQGTTRWASKTLR